MNSPTTMTDLRNKGQSAVIKKDPKSFPEQLKRMIGELDRALPAHMNADRMARIALTEFKKNKALERCNPTSILASLIISSQLGLEPGVLGQSYLVPYGDMCQLIPGWQGLADLVSRSGRASVWTGAVYRGDEFDYGQGDRPFIKHKSAGGSEDADDLQFVYAVGRIKEAEWPVIEVWSVEKVRRHRDRYNKIGKKHYSYDNFEMYGRKIALLQVLKYMPKSVELATAVNLDHAATRGEQTLTLDDALNGEFVDAVDDSHAARNAIESPAQPSVNEEKQSEAAGEPDKVAEQPSMTMADIKRERAAQGVDDGKVGQPEAPARKSSSRKFD